MKSIIMLFGCIWEIVYYLLTRVANKLSQLSAISALKQISLALEIWGRVVPSTPCSIMDPLVSNGITRTFERNEKNVIMLSG